MTAGVGEKLRIVTIHIRLLSSTRHLIHQLAINETAVYDFISPMYVCMYVPDGRVYAINIV